MRLFFAVELPPEVQGALGRLRPPDAAPGVRDYRWVDPALLHLTLAFLGDQPASELETLVRIGADLARTGTPMRLALAETGSFGSPRAPRVLWVGLRGDTVQLARLHRDLVEKLRAASFALEERPFQPHVTLARRRESGHGLLQFPWPPRTALPSSGFDVTGMALMRSELSPGGPRYTALQRFEFI